MIELLKANEFFIQKETDQLNGAFRLANELAEIGGDIKPIINLKAQLDQAFKEREEIITQQVGLKSTAPDYGKKQELLAARLVGVEAKLRRLFLEIPAAVKACQLTEFTVRREERVKDAQAELEGVDRRITGLLYQVWGLAAERVRLTARLGRLSEEYHKIGELNRGEEGVFDYSQYQPAYPWHAKMPSDLNRILTDYSYQVSRCAKYGGEPGADLLEWVRRKW